MDVKKYWLKKGTTLREWSHFLRLIREFFFERDFIEVQTPTLVPSSGAETHLHPLKVGEKYLPTSPEFHLKRALVTGVENIFEIKSCFRGRENSPAHATEFTMLEWYRANATAEAIKQDTIALFELLNLRLREAKKFEGHVKEITMAQLFEKYLEFSLTPQTSFADLINLCTKKQIHIHSSDNWNDLFHRLFVEFIEPNIARERPTIVGQFPARQAALAKVGEDGWAERFEVYFRGLEIANAYHELTDPDEYIRRFNQWNEEKKLLGYEPVPIDQGLIEALQVGMPASGGIALGLERLFMAFFQIRDIKDLQVLDT